MMPWKECSVMDERLRLVAQLLDGEAMSEVCRAFGISRKTGYKIFERYKEHGLEALTDRSRRPVRYANQLPRQIESLIVAAKRDKPHWGARKIRELLLHPRLPDRPAARVKDDRLGAVLGQPRLDLDPPGHTRPRSSPPHASLFPVRLNARASTVVHKPRGTSLPAVVVKSIITF